MQSNIYGRTMDQVAGEIEALDLEPIKFKLACKDDGPGWSSEHIERMAVAYKRFLILLARHPNVTIAPTRDIDTVWHTHILDTRKYAADCQRIFGEFLHHYPYLGLRGDQDRQVNAANALHELFVQEFGEAVPVNAGQRKRPAASPAADAAWCGREAAPAADAAWCGREAAPAADAAWCGREAAPAADAAWCGREAAPAADAAWCGREAAPAADAAWCGREAAPAADAAWCGREVAPAADAAWCGREAASTVESAEAAWCGRQATPAEAAAWCGREAQGRQADTAWCGREAAPAADAAWCGREAVTQDAPAAEQAAWCGREARG